MLIVSSITGQTEALTDIQGAEINEEVNGDFSIRFTTFPSERNLHSYDLLQEEAVIELDGHEYRIKQMIEERNRKTIYAQHIFFDLIDHQVYEINGGTKTLNEFMNILLTNTGWTFENMDVTGSKLIPNFGEDNVLSLIRLLCEVFECEIKVEPGRHIKVIKEIGEDNDIQFRYKHNIRTLKKSVDTSKLSTVIKGFGGNGLEVTYISPNANIYGERHAEPVYDERFTVPDSLTERIKRDLVDVPEVSIELEVIQLGFSAELGDKVWTIYEPMNIEFQQRIMARKWYPFTKRSPVVTLSNKKKSLPDLLTETRIEVKENQKQTRSEITQTNERIELKVSQTDYNGMTITSLISQDAQSISLLAQNLNLQGLVTFSNLQNSGETIINGGNIMSQTITGDRFYGNMFTVGNGVTNTKLEMYTTDNDAHYIQSNQAAGFRVGSTGSLSLSAGIGYGIYAKNAPLVAEAGFRSNGSAQFSSDISVSGTATISALNISGGGTTSFNGNVFSWSNLIANGSLQGANVSGGYFTSSDTSTPFRAYVGGAALVMELYNTSAYFPGDVYARGVKLTSDEFYKKNIEEYLGDALELINSTPIVEFHYTDEIDDSPKTIGIIAQSSPEEIISVNEDGLLSVSQYEMIALAWKAIQQLNEKIERSGLYATS